MLMYMGLKQDETGNKQYCCTCKWYAEFEGVCCCADSEWTADFRDNDYVCECWEEKADDK